MLIISYDRILRALEIQALWPPPNNTTQELEALYRSFMSQEILILYKT